jgi:hypothetical protein
MGSNDSVYYARAAGTPVIRVGLNGTTFALRVMHFTKSGTAAAARAALYKKPWPKVHPQFRTNAA